MYFSPFFLTPVLTKERQTPAAHDLNVSDSFTFPLHVSRFPHSFPGGHTDPKLTPTPAAKTSPENPNTCPIPKRVPRSCPNYK